MKWLRRRWQKREEENEKKNSQCSGLTRSQATACWLSGQGFLGYCWWNIVQSSGEWARSPADTQDVSSSIPSYPNQCTKYHSLSTSWKWWSILESSISLTSNSWFPSISIGGGGVVDGGEMGSVSPVPAVIHGTLGVLIGIVGADRW